MILHKLVSNAIAGKYLPFALSKLKALNAIFGNSGYFSERWKIENVDIQVQQSPPVQFVRLTGGYVLPQYEFVTSDYLSARTFSSPGYEPPTYQFGAIQAHALRVEFNGLSANSFKWRATPIYSTNLTPSSGKTWAQRAISNPLGYNITTKSQDYFKSWAWWQVQYFQERQWYYQNKPEVVVASCFGVTRASTGCVGLGDYFQSELQASNGSSYDVGYDLPPTVMRAGLGVTEGGFGPYMGKECWPRAGAMQEVEWKVGDRVREKRRFLIMGDNKGRLHIYPAKAYFNDPEVFATRGSNPGSFGSSLEGLENIPSTGSTKISAKVVTPDYPSWVTQADPDQRDVLLWWNWRFNKDATRAATVAMKDEVRPSWFFYNDPSVFNTNFTSTWYAYREDSFGDTYVEYPPYVIDPEGHKGWPPFHTSKKGPPARAFTPGLIEISLKIEITGPGENDYTASAKVEHAEHFYEAGRYFIDCGYLYDDPRLVDPNELDDKGKPKQMPEGTLIAAQLDVYGDTEVYNGGWYFKPYPDNDTLRSDPAQFNPANCQILVSVDAAYVVRRMDTDKEIRRIQLARRKEVIPYTYWNQKYKDPEDQPPLVPTGFESPAPTTRPLDITIQRVKLWAAWRDLSANGPIANARPHFYALLHMADLSSLSFITTSIHITYPGYTKPSFYWVPTVRSDRITKRIIGFNQEMVSRSRELYYINVQTDKSYSGDYDHYEDVPVTEDIAEIPMARRVYFPPHLHTSPIFNGIALDAINYGAYKTMSAHPSGHFIASNADKYEGNHFACDVVSVKKKDGSFYTGSVKGYFNSAFDQQRDYPYWSASPEKGDVGSFNICGYWLPFTAAA